MMNKILIAILLFASCTPAVIKKGPLYFGQSDGDSVFQFNLTNSKGDTVKITNYGATITHWINQDKNGKFSSIVLGFDSLQGYLDHPPYFGATVGRYGNRITNGHFVLDSTTYTLAVNNGKNHLHGGLKGFDKVVWKVDSANDHAVTLHYVSKDGEEGYPGNLDTHITFELSGDDVLSISYDATTDKPTVLNLTNHSYFNLTGDPSKNILAHQLKINANGYTPVDTSLIPTGEIKPVAGTPFDFNSPHAIGERIAQVPGGYDHNFVLNTKGSGTESLVTVTDSVSGRKLEVFTTQPGVQFYTGNFLDGTIKRAAEFLSKKMQPFVWKPSISLIHPTSHHFQQWYSGQAKNIIQLPNTNVPWPNNAKNLRLHFYPTCLLIYERREKSFV